MGLFPCDAGPHPYPGRQQTIYPAVAQGAHNARRKLRLCPRHFDQYQGELVRFAQPAQLELETERVPRCAGCGEEISEMAATFFATVYATGAERADWWAPIHEDCVGRTLTSWRLPGLY